MAWLNAIILVIQLAWAEIERNRAQAKQMRRQDRRGAISEQPTKANTDLFGPSAGLVRLDTATHQRDNVRPDTTED